MTSKGQRSRSNPGNFPCQCHYSLVTMNVIAFVRGVLRVRCLFPYVAASIHMSVSVTVSEFVSLSVHVQSPWPFPFQCPAVSMSAPRVLFVSYVFMFMFVIVLIGVRARGQVRDNSCPWLNTNNYDDNCVYTWVRTPSHFYSDTFWDLRKSVEVFYVNYMRGPSMYIVCENYLNHWTNHLIGSQMQRNNNK